MPSSRDVIDRLHVALDWRGVSQAELARRLGVSSALVSRWLSGSRSINADQLAEVLTELGLSWGDFFGYPPATGPYLSSALEESAALARRVELLEARVESLEES